MIIELPYGRGTIKADIPDGRIKAVIRSRIDLQPVRPDAVAEAMAHPIGTPGLEELARGRNKVVIIASDHTRPVPSRVIMPLMLEQIRRGNPHADITILIATGCHRGTTVEELTEKFGPEICKREKIVVHDCMDEASLTCIGTLPSGGRLVINSLAAQADLLVAEGFIEPHFFAGFSGGRKSVLPGIASRETVHYNHCSAFIASDRARCGILEGNPIHRDMVFAARRAGLAYIVNVVINSQKQVIAAFAGDMEQAHLAGCGYLASLARSAPEPADIVITTNNGYPLDQNIYQAVKGMTAAEATAAPGGVIIMAAQCVCGHGGQSFFDTFANDIPVGTITKNILGVDREKTVTDQWQSQVFARILEKHRVIFISDCPDETVRAMRMIPAHSIEEALAVSREFVGEDASITVIPEGVSSIIA